MNLWLPPNENQKLSLTGMKLLRLINQKFPAPILPRMLIVHFVAQITNDGTSFLPSLQEQTVYRSLFSESNEAVRRDYFPAEDALFEELNTVSEEQINLQDFVPDRSFYVGLLRSLWNRCGKYVINR
jgi:hypothetical protein